MAAQDVQGMLVRIEATTAQLRAEMKRADAAVGNATKGIDKQLSKVDGAFDRLGVGAGKAASAIRTLAPALAGLATIEALRRTQQLGEEFTLLEARVKRLSGGTAEAAVTYARLAEVARNSGTSLGETVKLWESLTGTLQEMGATDAQVVRLTDTLQKIGTIGGSSAQEVSNALRQLGQGLAGGVLRAEEFNSVIEGMPELAREIARGLGVPFSELRQMMLDGELTADKVLGAIQRRAYDVDAEFAKLPRTVNQASAALTNDLGRAISSLDSAIGGSRFLAKFLDTLAKGVRLTAGDLTDFERLNELVAERAQIQLRYEQAQRRTLLSDKERASFENSLKQLNAEIVEIQNRRIQQLKEEGREISANAPVINEQYDKYLAKLKESAALQGVNSEVAKVRYAIEKGELGTLTEAQQAALLKYAEEKDAKIEAQKAGLDYSQSLKEQAKALQDLANKYDPAAKAQAEYEKGIKLADEALLNGKYTTEQYQAVVQGLYVDLNKPIWDKHNKQADEAAAAIKKIDDQLESVRDRLDPVRAATKRLTAEKELLKEALDKGRISFEEYTQSVALLDKEYEDNKRKSSEWGQWTESALERVDGAFADAWRNIGDGFAGFRDSLTNAFKQMLAELAHLAITRPIVMQIGAALGIGGGGSGGILSSLGGSGGGGGFSLSNLLSYAQTGYSLMTGVGPAALAGYQSGGIMGGLQGAAGYYGNLASSAWGTVSGWFGGSAAAGAGSAAGTGFGLGQSVVSGQIGNAAYAGAQAGVGGNLSGMLGNLGAIVGPIAGLYMAIKGYGAISDGYDFKPKDFDDEFAGVRLGAKVINAYENGITKVFGDSSFLSKALRIPVATIGGLMSSVFGGGWETKNYGLAFSVANGDFLGQSYEDQKKKGGLFGSDKKRTKYRNLDPETAAALQETYDATQAGVADLFASLSLTVEEGSLDGLQLARQKISTKGKTEEEIQQAIAEWFGSAADAMTAELNKVFNTGLDLDLEGMQAFVGNLQGVNEVLRYLDVEMYDASVAGGKLAEALSAAAGGLEALATNSQTYYSAFFSDAEKVEDTIDSIKRAFESADVELASSRQAYREMVEDIDLTTEAGQEMFATLMQLSGQAAQYYSILEQQAAQANALLIGSVNTAYAALQRSIAAQQRDIQSSASKAAGNMSALTGIGNSLDAALKKLRGTSDDTVRSLRAQAVMTLNSALVQARSGQSLAGVEGLQDALDTASQMDTALYGSLADFEREQGRTANLIAELEKVNGKQLTAEEQMLEQYEKQMQRLDAQLAFAQAQLDALNGIDNSVMGVAAAIAAMNASVVAALGALPKGAAQANTPQNNGAIVSTLYNDLFGRTASAEEVAYWSGRLGSGNLEYSDIAANMKQWASAADKEAMKQRGIPGFAAGGFHSGGLRLVGENGPELEVTGPSRIYNASQTAAMLGGAGSTEELRALRSEVAGLRSALGAIAKYTESTAYGVRQMNEIGLPQPEAA